MSLRVLHCIPTIWAGSGGPPRSLTALAGSLQLADPDISISILSTDYGLTPGWRATLQTTGRRAKLFLHKQYGAHTRSVAPGMWLWLATRAGEFDLAFIHSLFHPTSSMCMAICKAHGLPFVVVPHGTLSPYTFTHGLKTVKKTAWALAERRLVSSSRGIVFTSSGEADKAARLGLPPKTFVVPLPVQPPQLVPRDYGSRVVLYLSRLDPKKNVGTLIEAFSHIHQAYPDARLVLAGRGPDDYERELRQQVQALALSDAVEFPGFVDGEAKEELLRRSGVFVLPSFEENFGVAVAEAMAARLPVVISPGVDLSPAVDRVKAGVIVAPEPKPLAEAILRLFADPGLGFEMGRRGSEFVINELDPLVIGHQFLDICRWAAAV